LLVLNCMPLILTQINTRVRFDFLECMKIRLEKQYEKHYSTVTVLS